MATRSDRRITRSPLFLITFPASRRAAREMSSLALFFGTLFLATFLLSASHALADDDSFDDAFDDDFASQEAEEEASADEGHAHFEQKEKDFILPKGDIRSGAGRTVLVSGESQGTTVGRIYVEGDKRYLITMPDGTMRSVTKDEVTATDRPFQGLTAPQIEKSLLNGPFKGFKSKRTKRYLYIYDSTDTFALATSRIVESMYPRMFNFFEKLDFEMHDPEFPLVVLIFGDKDSYVEYGGSSNSSGYYSPKMNYMVFFEDLEQTKAAPQMALKNAVGLIAHEGARQMMYNTGIVQRHSRWPVWLREGLCAYCAATETTKKVRWRGLGRVSNLRMWRLLKMREEADGEPDWLPLDEMLKTDRMLTPELLATSWGTIYAMAKSRKTKGKLAACLLEASKLGPLEKPPEAGYYFRKHFGDDLAKNRKHILRELSKAKKDYVDPVENQTYFLGLMDNGKRYAYFYTPSIIKLRAWAKTKSEELLDAKVKVRSYSTRSQAKAAASKFEKSKLKPKDEEDDD